MSRLPNGRFEPMLGDLCPVHGVAQEWGFYKVRKAAADVLRAAGAEVGIHPHPVDQWESGCTTALYAVIVGAFLPGWEKQVAAVAQNPRLRERLETVLFLGDGASVTKYLLTRGANL